MNARDFYLHVAEALSGCQLVEQELKLYISEALELVQKCVGDRLPFKMTGEAYENSALEGLIRTFQTFSDNPDLVRSLNKFKDERNFLSHRGITHCLDYDGDFDESAAAALEPRLLAIEPEAERLRIAVHEEGNKFRGNLYFEDFPPRNS